LRHDAVSGLFAGVEFQDLVVDRVLILFIVDRDLVIGRALQAALTSGGSLLR
jgi:hypothetical protein